MAMTKITILNKEQAKNLKGKTDLKKLKKFTDAELHQMALNDLDGQPLTAYELALFRPFVFLKLKLEINQLKASMGN